MEQALSVTELNSIVRNLLEGEATLSNVCVRGELSDYKI